MYLAVPTAVSKASVFSIGLECATGTCSHSHSHSRSALPKYFITSPWSRCSLSLSLSLSLASFSSSLYLYLSSLFFFLSPFLFNRRKKLFAVMSSCKARLIVVTMFLTKLKLLFETWRVRNSDGLSKIDHLSLPAIIEVVFVERIYSTISPRRRIVLVYRVPRYENAVLAAQI